MLASTAGAPTPLSKVSGMNINVGVLGHVDAGKTTLVRAMSTVLSTAALDKHPQSRERGITLDLGFSSFLIGDVQFTLVDCPGHASLLKTVIGGANIIDVLMLVVDVNKGIQAQTAECIVIAEILSNNLFIVMNKIDMADEDALDKAVKHMRKALRKTKFGSDVPIVSASGSAMEVQDILDHLPTYRFDVEAKRKCISTLPSDFLFCMDHCFQVKGHGTVMTGTVLAGSAKLGSTIHISGLASEKKIKSMQVFHQSAERIKVGDRAGICVSQLDASHLERGWVFSSASSLEQRKSAIVSIQQIRYYKRTIQSRSKVSVSIGHTTVEAKVVFVRGEYAREKTDYEIADHLDTEVQFGLLYFDRTLVVPRNAVYIASNLGINAKQKTGKDCRLAFHGNIESCDPDTVCLFRSKERKGRVLRIVDERTLIIQGLLQKNQDAAAFIGQRVYLQEEQCATIQGKFGQGDKLKIVSGQALENVTVGSSVCLPWKKYVQ